MSPSVNLVLGVWFMATGLAGTALQLWLWTFPMRPDPSGRDPNGVTTAPAFWRGVHRVLGYAFTAIYVLLMVQMVPRLWEFESVAWTPTAVAHAALGFAILPVLVFKVGILRFWQRHGKKLPLLGVTLAGLASASFLLAAPPFRKLASGEEPARGMVVERCLACHGASRTLSEDGDIGDWLETLEEMTENAEDLDRPDPVGSDARTLAEYLSGIRPDD